MELCKTMKETGKSGIFSVTAQYETAAMYD